MNNISDITFRIKTSDDCDNSPDYVLKRILSTLCDKDSKHDTEPMSLDEKTECHSKNGFTVWKEVNDVGVYLDLSKCDRRFDMTTLFKNSFECVVDSLDIRDSPAGKLDSILTDIDSLSNKLAEYDIKLSRMNSIHKDNDDLQNYDALYDTVKTTLMSIQSRLDEIYMKGKEE